MSIYIKVDRYGAMPRILQQRAVVLDVGEDQRGLLTFQKPLKPFFSIYTFEDRHLLKIEDPVFSVRSSDSQQIWLTDSLSLQGYDYTFSFVTTSAAAETLGRCEIPLLEFLSSDIHYQKLPKLLISLHHFKRSFPLFPGIELYIGSDTNDPIYLDIDGIRPRHCSVTFIEDQIWVKPLHGALTVGGEAINRAITVQQSQRVILQPTGIPFMIHYLPAPKCAVA